MTAYVCVRAEAGRPVHLAPHTFDSKSLTLCGRWRGSYEVVEELSGGKAATCQRCRLAAEL